MNEVTVERNLVVIAAEINSIKDQTRAMILSSSIEIGRRLVEAKAMFAHGEWGKWLEKSVDYSQDTANNLMKIYQEYGKSNSELIRNLSYTKAVVLLGVPQEEREQFAQENDLLNITVRKLQQTIDEKKKLEEDLKTAELEAEEERQQKQTLSESYERLERTNREHYENAERLRKELDEAKASGAQDEIERLQSLLNRADNDLAFSQKRIEELELQLKEPIEVTAAPVIERIPVDVQRELDELRRQSNKPVIKFTYCFDTLVTGFKDLLNALGEIPNPDDQEKYKHAVKGLIGKMSERL